MMEDVTVVVRECGERTADICVQMLAALVPQREIVRVTGRPFREMVRRSYEMGLAKGRPWTLCVDADVLVFAGAVQGLLDEARRLPAHAFEVQGVVFDKLFACWRPAGNHLYRTSFLRQALLLIPERDGSPRPESETIAAMTRKDGLSVQVAHRVGVHGFEQWSADIYEKAMLYAREHDYLLRYLLPLWQRLAEQDPDYRVALEAVRTAAGQTGPAMVGRHSGIERSHEAFSPPRRDDKPALTETPDPQIYVARLACLLGPTHAHLQSAFQKELDRQLFPEQGRWRRRWQTARWELAAAMRAARFAGTACLGGRSLRRK